MVVKPRRPMMVFIDLALVNLSMFLAFMMRFDWYLRPTIVKICVFFMIASSIIKVALFAAFGIYRWSFRYASISEAINVVKAMTISTLLLVAMAFFAQQTAMGRGVLLIDYLLSLFFVGGLRFSPRIILTFRQPPRANIKRALIVGAGDAGMMVAREILNAKVYQPAGFIDDDPAKLHSSAHGIKVLGTTDDMKDIVKKYSIDEIIIAIPSASGKVIRDIVSKCPKTEDKIKIIPGLHKILTGEVAVKQLRDVQLEDLLGRKTVRINTEDVSAFVENKTVLITGAAGSIGSELCRQIARFNPSLLILYDHNENDTYFLELELKENFPALNFKTVIGDIKDIGLLKHVFSSYRPQLVFHSAAHKHVPLMEENPVAAVKNNIIGTRNFMYAAAHYGVESFVMISTDKAVNPTSIMGASKRIAEMMIQAKAKSSKTKFMSVRFGNVMGSSGSVVPIFKKQIEKGGPVTVTHPEVKRFFMTADEAAQLVIQAAAMGKGGEVFILDMGEQLKILDLARNLITLSGLEPGKDIEIHFTGLRPGEKMHEETLLDAEHDKATKHDKIYIAQPDDFDSFKLNRDVKSLERFAELMAEDRIIEKIKEMVPVYTHFHANDKTR